MKFLLAAKKANYIATHDIEEAVVLADRVSNSGKSRTQPSSSNIDRTGPHIASFTYSKPFEHQLAKKKIEFYIAYTP